MIGIEIVKDKNTKESHPQLATELMEKLKDRRVLVGKGGAGGNVIRLQPPLCMSMEDAKYFLYQFEEVLKEYK